MRDMNPRAISFCAEFDVVDTLELRDRLKNMDIDNADSTEITVAIKEENEEYFEEAEVKMDDGSTLTVEELDSQEDGRFHIHLSPGPEERNFETSVDVISEVQDVIQNYNVEFNNMAIVASVESIDNNLPSDVSLDLGDFEPSHLEMKRGENYFGFSIEDEINFYIRRHNIEYTNLVDMKQKTLEELKEIMGYED